MNRQSGSQAPIPVTPSYSSPSQQPLLQFSGPPPNTPKTKRRSRDSRASWLFPARQKVSSIWRPSTGNHTPPTPQWPLPRVPLKPESRRISTNPAFTTTYTQPRDAPLPPPPSSRCSQRSSSGDSSSSSSSSTTTTTVAPANDRAESPGPTKEKSASRAPAAHPLSPRSLPSLGRPAFVPLDGVGGGGGGVFGGGGLGSGGISGAGHQRGGSFSTRYINMVLSIERIPRSHNILSNVFSWMILVAFVVAPANFCSPSPWGKTSGEVPPIDFYTDVPSMGLLGACFAIFGVGALGMLYLALCWRRNYIWLMNRIYLPLILHSLAGFIACLVILKVQHNMWWSISSYVTIAVEAGTLLFSTSMFCISNYLLLGKLKREHHRETSKKNVVDLVKAGKQPPFAPGSVV